MEEGKSVSDYAQDAGLLKTVVTRHLLDIGTRDRDGDAGLGLISQARDPKDLRINRAWITRKGGQHDLHRAPRTKSIAEQRQTIR